MKKYCSHCGANLKLADEFEQIKSTPRSGEKGARSNIPIGNYAISIIAGDGKRSTPSEDISKNVRDYEDVEIAIVGPEGSIHPIRMGHYGKEIKDLFDFDNISNFTSWEDVSKIMNAVKKFVQSGEKLLPLGDEPYYQELEQKIIPGLEGFE